MNALCRISMFNGLCNRRRRRWWRKVNLCVQHCSILTTMSIAMSVYSSQPSSYQKEVINILIKVARKAKERRGMSIMQTSSKKMSENCITKLPYWHVQHDEERQSVRHSRSLTHSQEWGYSSRSDMRESSATHVRLLKRFLPFTRKTIM